MKHPYLLLLAVYLISLPDCSAPEKQIKYTDLVYRLTDMESLSMLPEKGEQCVQWSSYDRASIYNDTTGKYENWDANADGSGFIRMEGEDMVLAEMNGPGAIVRMWSALPQEGHVKIFIDGYAEPVIDLPFRQYFDCSVNPFDYSELVYISARGQNNYVPISYQESCKVVAGPEWGRYFHFTYINFPAGTVVEPFSMDLDDEAKSALESVNDYFAASLGLRPYSPEVSSSLIKETINVIPGDKIILAEIEGAHAISSLRMQADLPERESQEMALRLSELTMYWDGEDQPSVWSPLGDFFGTAPGINNYKSMPLGMTTDGMYCFWYMPFTQGARIELINQSEISYELEYEITYGELSQPVDRYGRFHAKWHGDVFPVQEDRWPDWTLLKTEGTGRYVGTMINILTEGREPCVEAAGTGHAWWGEGDEKFFIDGEMFPGTFGTGTEDYFGYAWGTPEYFEKPFHSQSLTMNNLGYQTVSRWHITDNIPFMDSFEGYLEKYYPNDCGTRYKTIVYWYLEPGGSDLFQPAKPILEKIELDH